MARCGVSSSYLCSFLRPKWSGQINENNVLLKYQLDKWWCWILVRLVRIKESKGVFRKEEEMVSIQNELKKTFNSYLGQIPQQKVVYTPAFTFSQDRPVYIQPPVWTAEDALLDAWIWSFCRSFLLYWTISFKICPIPDLPNQTLYNPL